VLPALAVVRCLPRAPAVADRRSTAAGGWSSGSVPSREAFQHRQRRLRRAAGSGNGSVHSVPDRRL
jgi:hypothetical protein